jgi:hypothetical protein
MRAPDLDVMAPEVLDVAHLKACGRRQNRAGRLALWD